jgi:hypothetical protein
MASDDFLGGMAGLIIGDHPQAYARDYGEARRKLAEEQEANPMAYRPGEDEDVWRARRKATEERAFRRRFIIGAIIFGVLCVINPGIAFMSLFTMPIFVAALYGIGEGLKWLWHGIVEWRNDY